MVEGYDLAAVFIHGLFSGKHTWDDLIRLLQDDREIAAKVCFERFSYSSPKFSFNPLRRIPTLSDLAEQLDSWLVSNPNVQKSDGVVLVGHSLGGLVIQKFLCNALTAGRGRELGRVRRVALIAVPNNGSELLMLIRRMLGVCRFWRHAQERVLRPLNEDIEAIRRVILSQSIYATGISESTCKIQFDVYAGAEDGVVPPLSAKSVFPCTRIVPGDHFSIIQNASPELVAALKKSLREARRTLAPDGFHLCTEHLDPDNLSDLEEVISLQHERFPAHVHIEGDDLRGCFLNYERCHGIRPYTIVARLNRVIRGFMLFSEAENMLVVGYLAVVKDAEAIVAERLIERLRDIARSKGNIPAVFEVQSSDGPKIRFFGRYGAKIISGLTYVAPDMTDIGGRRLEESHVIMFGKSGTLPEAMSRERVLHIIGTFYRVAYRCWFSERYESKCLDAYFADLIERSVPPNLEAFPLVDAKVYLKRT